MALSLPIIDIAPYLDSGLAHGRKDVAKAIHAACTDYGFFYLDITSYLADIREPDELATLARQFFALPQDEKDKISLKNQDYARGAVTDTYMASLCSQWMMAGYQRLKENVTSGKADNHEAIDFYRPVDNPDKSKPLWGENQWPAEPAEFREKYEIWVDKMKVLGLIVMEA